MSEMSSSIKNNAIGLTLFALVTAGIVGFVQMITQDKIAYNIKEAKAKALFEIVPKSDHNNSILEDTLLLGTTEAEDQFDMRFLGPIRDGASAHYARQDGELVAIVLPAVAPDGYTTDIDLIVGIYPSGELAGVRVVSHKETPGLGDKIELAKSNWIKEFDNKSLLQPEPEKWKVKKDGGEFDQFTGATITPRAVVNAVNRALQFFDKHKSVLLAHPAPIVKQPTVKQSIAEQPIELTEVNHGN